MIFYFLLVSCCFAILGMDVHGRHELANMRKEGRAMESYSRYTAHRLAPIGGRKTLGGGARTQILQHRRELPKHTLHISFRQQRGLTVIPTRPILIDIVYIVPPEYVFADVLQRSDVRRLHVISGDAGRTAGRVSSRVHCYCHEANPVLLGKECGEEKARG